MTLGFAITCMARLDHLKRTLPRNLDIILAHGQCSLTVLDYNCPDGTAEWITKSFPPVDGFRVYKEEHAKQYSSPRSKNLAHKLCGDCDYLCNLDADNVLDPRFPSLVIEAFETRPHAGIVHPTNVNTRHPIMGRVACRRGDFLAVGGYREALTCYGYDDHDLMNRVLMLPRTMVRCWTDDADLSHSDERRTMLMALPDKPVPEADALNRAYCHRAYKTDGYLGNKGRKWGTGVVVDAYCGHQTTIV